MFHFCSLLFEIQLVMRYGLVNVVVCLQRNATVKVKLSVCRPYGNVGGAWVQLHPFLTSSLNGGKWQVSSANAILPPRERAPPLVTHQLGTCVGPTTSLEAWERICLVFFPGIEPGFLGYPVRSLVFLGSKVTQIVLRLALVSGEHINVNRIIYSFINTGQSKI